MKKRQEIGRGMRLPVNQDGERIFDDTINRLTVIANESYDDFARMLQTEIEDDFGIKFGRIPNIAFAKVIQVVDDEPKPIGNSMSVNIWEDLRNSGYINDAGDVQPLYNPEDKSFELKLNPEHIEFKNSIIETIDSYLFKNRLVNKKNRKTLKINKQVFLDPDFKELWNRIKQKTTYSVEFDSNVLIKNGSKAIAEMEKIEP